MMKSLITFLILCLFLASCEKTEEVPFNIKGTIKGNVISYDECGFENSIHDSITVTLDGSKPLISALTDSSGEFTMENVPMGTYDIVYSKPGYGTYKYMGYQFKGEDQTYNTLHGYLYEISKTKINNISIGHIIYSNEWIYFPLEGNIIHNFEYGRPAIRLFFSNTPDVSSSNYLYTVYKTEGYSLYDSIFNIDVNIFNSNFLTDDDIYVIAYGMNPKEYYGYTDIITNEKIYTSLGEPSNVASNTTTY